MTDELYEMAEEQAGYFTSNQARAAGISPSLLSYHSHVENFLRVSRGVYRLKKFPASPHEDLFAAWLRTGPRGVISHESALAVYELSDVLPGEIHVTVPRTASRRRPGLRLHTTQLDKKDITRRAGLPVTTVPRTIADLAAAGLPVEQIEKAIWEAMERGLVERRAVVAMAAKRGGRVGRIIRDVLTKVEAG